MTLFCIILALYGIYCLIEETENEKAALTEKYREKELSELRALRDEVAELKKRERTLLMRRRTLEKGELLMKEELLEEKESYK
jgi:uncharacterized protein YlxW (UPF0749 family)